MDRYIVAFLVKGEISQIHNGLVDLVANTYNLRKIKSPSHITLKDSIFTEDILEIETIISAVVESNLPHGKVRIQGINNFRNEVYFLDVRIDDNVRNIYLELFKHLKQVSWIQWDKFDVEDLKFHITITNKANLNNFEKIEELLHEYKSVEAEIDFDNISILKKLDDGQWIVHKEYRIG